MKTIKKIKNNYIIKWASNALLSCITVTVLCIATLFQYNITHHN